MAGPLAAVERFFERLFERPAARLFQARIEPVQIQRSLERAMEAERAIHARRAYAPSTYRVLLSAVDLAALGTDHAALRSELSEALRVYARAHGYTLLARPHIAIEPSNVVASGDIRVFADPPAIPTGAPPFSIDMDDGPKMPEAEARPEQIALSQATAVFAAPRPSVPRAVLAIRTPGRGTARFIVRAGTMRLGRARDNEIVLADDRVSRRHGQIGLRLGMLVYTDLSSTNGSFLNGSPVTEIALGPGDVLQLGSSTVTIEPGN